MTSPRMPQERGSHTSRSTPDTDDEKWQQYRRRRGKFVIDMSERLSEVANTIDHQRSKASYSNFETNNKRLEKLNRRIREMLKWWEEEEATIAALKPREG